MSAVVSLLLMVVGMWIIVGYVTYMMEVVLAYPKFSRRRTVFYALLSGPLAWVMALGTWTIGCLVGLIEKTYRHIQTKSFWQRFNTWLDAA